MYVVVEAQQAGQHKFVYCEVLRVRNMRYYFKNNSVHDAPVSDTNDFSYVVMGVGCVPTISTECSRRKCSLSCIFVLRDFHSLSSKITVCACSKK